MSEQKCRCLDYASPDSVLMLVAGHHPRCNHYPGEKKILRELIRDLVKGIECWAADEDGVHDDAWEAYQKAKLLIDGVLLEGESR